jgi:hypothetical protein
LRSAISACTSGAGVADACATVGEAFAGAASLANAGVAVMAIATIATSAAPDWCLRIQSIEVLSDNI